MTQPLQHYAAEFAKARESAPQPLVQLREDALHRFLTLGFPTVRDEEWRFTSVAPIAERTFALDAGLPVDGRQAGIAPFRLRGPTEAELVFVDGRYVPALSNPGTLPHGVVVESLASRLARDPAALEPHLARIAPFDRHAFIALNTAFLADGAYIQIPPGAALDAPIHVLFVSSGDAGRETMSHPRVLVVLGENSQAVVVETYASMAPGAAHFTNAVTEVAAGDRAVLQHYRLQQERADAFHVGAVYVHARRGAHVASHSITLGGALVRNDVVAVLDGEGAECTLNGLYLADAQRLVDNHTTIDHAQPHCNSRELYKGILADRARGVFNGKIVVRQDAQKTDAKQTNRALLLSEHAQINTKPQLEIFANDVRCTHGAAVGQLDEEAVFYLRSRGLGEPAARRLLIHAFAGDVLRHMPLQPVRTTVEGLLQGQLARMLPAAA